MSNTQDIRCVVFGPDHPNTLGAVRSLGEAGYRADAVIVRNSLRMVEYSRHVSSFFSFDSYVEALDFISDFYGNKPTERIFVITCDDEGASLIDSRSGDLPDNFVIFKGATSGIISHYINKHNINTLAKKHGLNVLPEVVTENGVVPQGLTYPVITKSISPLIGGWKSDVFKCDNEEELCEAFKKIQAPTVLIQQYLKKKNELCIDGFRCNGTTVITMVCKYLYLLDTAYSSYMSVENFHDDDLFKKIDSLLQEVDYEGIFCIEFLIAPDGELFFCEVNFRNSGWSYVSTVAGMNLPDLWIKSVVNGKVPEEAVCKIKPGFTAIYELPDFSDRVIHGAFGLLKWLAEYRKADCRLYLGKKDARPFLMLLKQKLKGKISKRNK